MPVTLFAPKLSYAFFLPRTSPLHKFHPLTKLVAALCIVLIGFLASWPHLPLLLFVFLILPLAAWGQLFRDVGRATLTVILPFVLSISLVQGFFYPGATHVIFSIGPFALKEEGLLFAYRTLGKISVLAGAGLLLMFSTHPADLMLALVQRGFPNALAYIVMTAIQLLPHMQAKATAIANAQRARGLETDANFWRRSRALLALVGPLVFSALIDVNERALALEARAFSAPCSKTSLKELHDSRGQVLARWAMLILLMVFIAWQIWEL